MPSIQWEGKDGRTAEDQKQQEWAKAEELLAGTPTGTMIDRRVSEKFDCKGLDGDPLSITHKFVKSHDGKVLIRTNGDLLGKGGFGTVSYYEDREEHKYALKSMDSRHKGTAKKETEIAIDLDIATGEYEHNGKYIVVYHYLGQDLDKYLKANTLDEEEQFNISLQLLRKINDLHTGVQSHTDTRIAHRDIKPPNITIDRDGKLYLIDLGLSSDQGVDENPTYRTGTTSYLSRDYYKQSLLQGDIFAAMRTMHILHGSAYFRPEERPRGIGRHRGIFSEETIEKYAKLKDIIDTKDGRTKEKDLVSIHNKMLLIQYGLFSTANIQKVVEDKGAALTFYNDIGILAKDKLINEMFIEELIENPEFIHKFMANQDKFKMLQELGITNLSIALAYIADEPYGRSINEYADELIKFNELKLSREAASKLINNIEEYNERYRSFEATDLDKSLFYYVIEHDVKVDKIDRDPLMFKVLQLYTDLTKEEVDTVISKSISLADIQIELEGKSLFYIEVVKLLIKDYDNYDEVLNNLESYVAGEPHRFAGLLHISTDDMKAVLDDKDRYGEIHDALIRNRLNHPNIFKLFINGEINLPHGEIKDNYKILRNLADDHSEDDKTHYLNLLGNERIREYIRGKEAITTFMLKPVMVKMISDRIGDDGGVEDAIRFLDKMASIPSFINWRLNSSGYTSDDFDKMIANHQVLQENYNLMKDEGLNPDHYASSIADVIDGDHRIKKITSKELSTLRSLSRSLGQDIMRFPSLYKNIEKWNELYSRIEALKGNESEKVVRNHIFKVLLASRAAKDATVDIFRDKSIQTIETYLRAGVEDADTYGRLVNSVNNHDIIYEKLDRNNLVCPQFLSLFSKNKGFYSTLVKGGEFSTVQGVQNLEDIKDLGITDGIALSAMLSNLGRMQGIKKYLESVGLYSSNMVQFLYEIKEDEAGRAAEIINENRNFYTRCSQELKLSGEMLFSITNRLTECRYVLSELDFHGIHSEVTIKYCLESKKMADIVLQFPHFFLSLEDENIDKSCMDSLFKKMMSGCNNRLLLNCLARTSLNKDDLEALIRDEYIVDFITDMKLQYPDLIENKHLDLLVKNRKIIADIQGIFQCVADHKERFAEGTSHSIGQFVCELMADAISSNNSNSKGYKKAGYQVGLLLDYIEEICDDGNSHGRKMRLSETYKKQSWLGKKACVGHNYGINSSSKISMSKWGGLIACLALAVASVAAMLIMPPIIPLVAGASGYVALGIGLLIDGGVTYKSYKFYDAKVNEENQKKQSVDELADNICANNLVEAVA